MPRRASLALGLLRVAAAVFCLSVSAAAARNYVQFHWALRVKAADVLTRNQARLSGGPEEHAQDEADAKKQLAEEVVRAVQIMQDPATHRPGSGFGMAFSSIVWDAGIRSELQSVFVMGKPSKGRRNARVPFEGAVVKQTCYGIEDQPLDKTIVIGELGWPCNRGGAVIIQKQTASRFIMNCIVYYFPLISDAYTPECLVTGFKSILKASTHSLAVPRLHDAIFSDKLDLNAIALRFDRERLASNRRGFFRFVAVAFIPCLGVPYGDIPASQPAVVQGLLTSAFGIFADVGHFCIDHFEVPMHHEIDLNVRVQPVYLYAIVAVPSGAMCNEMTEGLS